MGKGRRFGKYKRVSGRIQEKNGGRSKTIGEIGYGRRKGLEKGEVTRKIYGKNVIWIG